MGLNWTARRGRLLGANKTDRSPALWKPHTTIPKYWWHPLSHTLTCEHHSPSFQPLLCRRVSYVAHNRISRVQTSHPPAHQLQTMTFQKQTHFEHHPIKFIGDLITTFFIYFILIIFYKAYYKLGIVLI